MTDPPNVRPALPETGRRAFLLAAGAGAGLLATRGLGVGLVRAGDAGPIDHGATLRALAASFTPGQRALVVLPADHPSRQIGNTIAVLERPHLGTLLSPAQRALVEQLYLSMLSPRGRDAFAGTVAVEGRLEGCVLAIYGEPERGDAHAVLMGGHVMLRGGGGAAGDGSPFGGPVAYGHQIGNETWRVEGNSFAYHGGALNQLFALLSPDEKARAVEPEPPHELVLQVQRAGARFPGVRIGSLGEAARGEAPRVLDTVLSAYPEAERARAWACIGGNGGLDAVHVACYSSRGFYRDMRSHASLAPAERARRGDPYWQVWRLEGPGTIVHFKGYPHVHAYLHVVRDPSSAGVGETIASAPAGVEGAPLRRLIEGALRRATGEAIAFHVDEVPGRICPGAVTTGLAYSLDPYRNHVAVATIAGRAMAPPLRARLAERGVAFEPGATYRVATASFFAGESDSFGEPDRVEPSSLLLRDALVAHLRAGGLDGAPG